MKHKNTLLVLFAIVITGGVVAWTYVNRPIAKVEQARALAITAESLNNAYSDNEETANKKYINKALEVSGLVAEVSKNQDGKTVLLLQSDDPMSGVQCTMRDDVNIDTGKKITVKGFCTGYTMVVLLSDCILL